MKIINFLVCFGLLIVAPIASRACSCAEVPPAREAFKKSSLVFFGKVISINVKKKTRNYLLDAEVKVKIEKTWKGKPSKFIVLRNIGGNCPAFDFARGKEYVFYLPQPQKGKKPAVFACSWIRGKADLKWLSKVKAL